MLAMIKLIGSNEHFSKIEPTDYVPAPEKPIKRRKAGKKAATDITELDDTFEPLSGTESEEEASNRG
jgi:hypothetical protein